MAKVLGRKLIISRDGTPIANVRTKSLNLPNELVDVTDGDSAGWQTYLDEVGQKGMNISVEGVLATDALRQEAMSMTGIISADTITDADGAEWSGNFALANYSEEHPYNEAATFSAELQSSGAITYTPAA